MSDSRVVLPIAISLGALASGAWAGRRGHFPAETDRGLLETTVPLATCHRHPPVLVP
jgi:hypothetical protein